MPRIRNKVRPEDTPAHKHATPAATPKTSSPLAPRLLGEDQFQALRLAHGGRVPHADLGGWLKKLGKNIWSGYKGAADGLLSTWGMGDVIDNTFIDNSKFLTGYTNVLSSVAPLVLDAVAPGAGRAVQAGASAINSQFKGPAPGAQGGGGAPQGGMPNMGVPPNMLTGAGAAQQGTPYMSNFGEGLFRFAAGGFPQTGGPGDGPLAALDPSVRGLYAAQSRLAPVAGSPTNLLHLGDLPQRTKLMLRALALTRGELPPTAVGGQHEYHTDEEGKRTPLYRGGLSYTLTDLAGKNPHKVGGPTERGIRGRMTDYLESIYDNRTPQVMDVLSREYGLMKYRPEGDYPRPEQRAEGGPVGGPKGDPNALAPLQAEKYRGQSEYIVTPNLDIAKVRATKAHERMGADEVTDLVEPGSYVASARPKMSFTRKELEQIPIRVDFEKHAEGKTGAPPKEVTAADILPKGKNKVTPAEYAELVAKRYPLPEDREDGDPFVAATRESNRAGRLPYLQVLTTLGERNREREEGPRQPAAEPVQRADNGDWIGPAMQALPLIMSAMGSAGVDGMNGFGQNGALDPVNDAMMLAAAPLYAQGVTNNVRSQEASLDNALANLTGLTQQQMDLSQMGSLAQMMGSLGQETRLPDLQQNFSRLENFDTRTPQQFIQAAGRPTVDTTAYLDRLGGRAGGAALAQQQSMGLQARNQAAQQAFTQDRASRMGLAQQLTQGYNAQEQYNNNLRQQEVAARNNVLSGVTGAVQQGMQNRSNILAGAYTTGTQLDMQRASLAGQIPSALAQNMFNTAAVRQSFMMPPELQGGQQPQQGQYSAIDYFQGMPSMQQYNFSGAAPAGPAMTPSSSLTPSSYNVMGNNVYTTMPSNPASMPTNMMQMNTGFGGPATGSGNLSAPYLNSTLGTPYNQYNPYRKF